jgi:hypothetical protein
MYTHIHNTQESKHLIQNNKINQSYIYQYKHIASNAVDETSNNITRNLENTGKEAKHFTE